MIPPLTRIGRISAKHGYKGEVSIALEDSSHYKNIKKGNFLFVEVDGKGVPFLIENCTAGGSIVKLADIDTEEDAKSIIGTAILIEKNKVKKRIIPDFENLKGFVVFDNQSDFKGSITRIEIYPQGPMLEVSNHEKTYLIPLVEDWITEIDEENKLIGMQLPEGLTEI
ncbi:MAG: hypothetical protein RLZZ161_886 [Bacteroidota bacterium]